MKHSRYDLVNGRKPVRMYSLSLAHAGRSSHLSNWLFLAVASLWFAFVDEIACRSGYRCRKVDDILVDLLLIQVETPEECRAYSDDREGYC
jgi:hypothetical protein